MDRRTKEFLRKAEIELQEQWNLKTGDKGKMPILEYTEPFGPSYFLSERPHDRTKAQSK